LRKYYIIMLGVFLLVGSNLIMGINSDPKIIPINQILQVQVDLAGQKQAVIVPTNPLNFDSTLEWNVTITKKGLASEKDAAFFTIEDLGSPVKQIERKTISGAGKITIPKGVQFKVTLYAGEYSRLISRDGASVQAKLKYAEAQVQYSQGDKPYQFNLEVLGPAGLNNWSWLWGSNDLTTGNQVAHQFTGEGKFPVIVEGKGKALNGLTTQKFYFELEVPPLIVMNPKVDPLKGPVELNITARVNAVVNYGQKASYTWDFGNGVELSGPEVGNNLVKPGKYQILLTAKVADYTFYRNWLVEVQPLNIIANPVVTPLTGPVPLNVAGTINPQIVGGPTQLKFSWTIGNEVVEGNEFKHNFTDPGDYQLIFQTVDKLHPALIIPETAFLIKALPPQMDIKPTASIAKGIIPLSVNLDPHLTVQGSPVELIYHWDFGDGETSDLEKPNHIFKKPGAYDVQLAISDRLHQGNLVTASIPVTILPPEMKVSVTPNVSSGLAPLTVNFNAQMGVIGSPCDPQYSWDFGDGGTSVEQNPIYTFRQEGKYSVVLEVKDWLHPTSSVKTTVVIDVRMPKIRLTTTVTPVTGKAPLTINCQAWADKEGSTNAKMKFVWDFGDGGVTVEGMDQQHTFEKPGTYNVLVFVEDQVLGITERKTFKVVVK
jgi:PKD repeat protein